MTGYITAALLMNLAYGPACSVGTPGASKVEPSFIVLGSSPEAGEGASRPEDAFIPMFAEYLADGPYDASLHTYILAEPGAAAADIGGEQAKRARRINAKTHPLAEKVIWVTASDTDWWNLMADPRTAEICSEPAEEPQLGLSYACFDWIRPVSDTYEANLRAALERAVIAKRNSNATIIVATEFDSFGEANCAENGAIASDGTILVSPPQIQAIGSLLPPKKGECDPPTSSVNPDFPGYEGPNFIAGRVAAEYGAIFVDPLDAFADAALSPDADLVGPDCRTLTDEGHALMYSLAIEAWEAGPYTRGHTY